MLRPAYEQNMLLKTKAGCALVSVPWTGMSEQATCREIGTKQKLPQFAMSCTGSDHEL